MRVKFFKIMTRMSQVVAFLLLLKTASGSSVGEKTDDIMTMNDIFCPDFKPQGDLDFDQIMGEWYVVEIVKHKVDSVHPTVERIVLETCPSVRIRFSTRTSLRLLWNEKVGDLEYSFVIPDFYGTPGLWESRGLQNGTLLSRKYVQFSGTVQVMKAVASHMVLTFCSKTPDNQMYSILLSRKRDLPEDDSTGVRNLLSRRGLTIATIQQTCRNGGTRKESSSAMRWITVLVVALLAAASATGI